MIEKMKYINIMGHVNDFDEIVKNYVAKYDMQLENAINELNDMDDIVPFQTTNPYSGYVNAVNKFINNVKINENSIDDISEERTFEIINILRTHFSSLDLKLKGLGESREHLRDQIATFEPFVELDFNIDKLSHFNFLTYRFGKMPVTNFMQFEKFLYDDKDILFVKGKSDEDYIYCVYFTSKYSTDRVDSIFSSLNFDIIHLQFDLFGMSFEKDSKEAYKLMTDKLKVIEDEINKIISTSMEECGITIDEFSRAYNKILTLNYFYETRKYAAKTPKNFFILVGWISEKDSKKFDEATLADEKVIVMLQNEDKAKASTPPTKLKNLPFVKPFEQFVKMYGIPTYGEIDSTFYLAITYTLIFGIMFGDVGQGLILAALGLFLKVKKNIALGSILSIIGLSSTFFGFLYGSVFGFEEFIPALWIKPYENINQILTTTVVLGIVLIFISMALNIINAINKKDLSRFLLNPNGISGIIFYATLLYTAVASFFGYPLNKWIIAPLLIIPILVIAFREPLSNIMKGEKAIHGSIVFFIIETIVELFEILLTYFTNTVSFVRVGAFALSHAGMMSVVLMLSETSAHSHNIVGIIIGNALVICVEGVIVGIQVLRLEFYEIFSRFFDGDGKEFVSYKYKNIKNKNV